MVELFAALNAPEPDLNTIRQRAIEADAKLKALRAYIMSILKPAVIDGITSDLEKLVVDTGSK